MRDAQVDMRTNYEVKEDPPCDFVESANIWKAERKNMFHAEVRTTLNIASIPYICGERENLRHGAEKHVPRRGTHNFVHTTHMPYICGEREYMESRAEKHMFHAEVRRTVIMQNICHIYVKSADIWKAERENMIHAVLHTTLNTENTSHVIHSDWRPSADLV